MLVRAREIINKQIAAMTNLPLGASFEQAVRVILETRGKLITTGIGKAGYVAKKAASTFSTTGTPSLFLHPGDASHGDVGVLAPGDVLLALSNSGRTREVLETVHFCRKLGVDKVIGVTANSDSPLGQESCVVLELGHIEEPCPFGLTPTASTQAMLALTDTLALIVMEERGFTRAEFALRHHGGYLGEKARE